MSRYSVWSLLTGAATGHRHAPRAWRATTPKSSYDVIIVGGGGHGLATAYYLAKEHGIRNVAVLEKGWLGGGNTGRNTQGVRSNYFWEESARFYDHSLKLYEGLTGELNFNIMLSQRGVINLAHSPHDLEILRRWVSAIHINGVDSELLDVAEISRRVPLLNVSGRYPVVGGFIQERAGIARHDAVAWGFARAADRLGVDIVQRCEVTGFNMSNGRVCGVSTSQGEIHCDRVVMSVAGNSSAVAALAGLRLPLTSMALQAMVTEPIKPCLDTVVVSPVVHVYVSQSDRGEIVIGGGADVYASFSQRGSAVLVKENIAALLELFPAMSQLRLMRQWAGTVDVTPDTSPLMGLTPIGGLYINAGWGTGGFKAIPAGGQTMAWTVAHDTPHPLIRGFGLDRFEAGRLIDEAAAAGVAH